MSKPVGPYTPIVRAGDVAYCSGQIGISDGVLVEGFEAQVRQSLFNLTTVLRAEGLELSDVSKTNLYLTDMSNFSLMNEVYLEAFDGLRLPARAAVGVASLPLGALFEIEAIAHA